MSGDSSEVIAEQMNGSNGGIRQEQLDDEENNGVCELPSLSAKTRPADVDADIREMERRKRVDSIMNSRMFREELERIIELQMHDGTPATSSILQRITDMMGMSSNGTRMQSGGIGCGGTGVGSNTFRNLNSVMPINDIRGIENIAYDKGEKMLRCKLAALYRLIDQFGWSYGGGGGGLGANNVQNVVTARLSHDLEHFLTNPFGLMFHEITASSLIKADMQGNVVEQGTTNYALNQSGYLLNAAIHATRPDLKCIIGVQTPAIVAVSALKCGLLPLSSEACLLGDVSRHHFATARCSDPEAQRDQIVRDFGPINKVLLLLNRGAICAGETIEEAFFHLYNLAMACETQLRLISVPPEQLQLIGDDERKFIYENARHVPDAGVVVGGRRDDAQEAKRWRLGGVEFDALMRMLDNCGFRTGHIARYPLVKSDPPKPRNDCEVPPAVSHLGYLLEEEEMYRQGTWKRQDGSLGHHRKGNERSRWLNSPNVYQKVEVLETGTVDPKKITKWVAEDSPTHSSTPVRIDPAMQFVPANTNPTEFKKLQKQIKDYRRADKKSAGPQSQILDGVTLEEAQNIQRIAAATAAAAVSSANSSAGGGTNDRVVLMGAASKGIIQRDYQNNATVYKTPYAKNPFDRVTDEDVVEYRKMVERAASSGGRGDDTDFSESEATSTSAAAVARLPPSSAAAAAAAAKSPTDDDESSSLRQRVVVQVETKHAPKPSQPEIVMSDAKALVVTKRNHQHQHQHQDHLDLIRNNNNRNVWTRVETINSKVPKTVTISSSASILKPRYYRTYSHAGFPKGQFIQPNLPHYHIARWSRVAELKKPYRVQDVDDARRTSNWRHIGIQVGKNNVSDHRGVQCTLIGNDDSNNNNDNVCGRCHYPLINRSHDQSILDTVADNLVKEIEHESGNYQSFEICSDDDGGDGGDDEYHEDDLFMDQNNNSECWKLTSIQEETEEVEEEEDEEYKEEEKNEKKVNRKETESIKQFATILNRFILFEMNNKYNSHDDFYWSELQDYFSVLSFIFYRDQLFCIDRDQFRQQITNQIAEMEKSTAITVNENNEYDDDYHFTVNELIILVCELMWEDCTETNEIETTKSIDIFNSTPQSKQKDQNLEQPQQIQPFLAYCNDQNNSFELWYSFSRSGENENGLQSTIRATNSQSNGRTTMETNSSLNLQLSYGKSLASKYLQKCSFQIYYDSPNSRVQTVTNETTSDFVERKKTMEEEQQQQSDLNETTDWMGLDSAIF